MPKQLIWECSSCSPNFKLGKPSVHCGAACDRSEITEIPKLPPIPEVVWQQPSETYTNHCNPNNTNNDFTRQNNQKTSKTTVASQTSPTKGTQPQKYVIATEYPPVNQIGNQPVPLLNCSKNCPIDNQNSEQHVTTTLNGNTTTPLFTTATPLSKKALVRDEQTNEVYLPLTSTIVLKRKQGMLYVLLVFENNLTVDAPVDSGAVVSAIAQINLDTIKEKASNNILKIDDPPNFQIEVANGQLEKPLSTATLKFEIGDNIFAEHFVIMKKLTGPIIVLQYMSNNRVVIGTTHGLIHFPHLMMQVKAASSETSQNPSQSSLTIPRQYHR